MKTNSRVAASIVVLAALAILCTPRNVNCKPQRFLWGPYQGLYQYNTTGELEAYLARWVDTLKCNFFWEEIGSASNAETFSDLGLEFKAPDSQYVSGHYVPGHRGFMGLQHYLVWPTDSASVSPWLRVPHLSWTTDGYSWRWIQGRKQIVSGDTVWAVSSTAGDTRGWVLNGPWSFCVLDESLPHIAQFKVKFSNLSGIPATDTLAKFYFNTWVGGGTHDDLSNYRYHDSLTILRSQATGDTQTVQLQWTNSYQDTVRWFTFPVYWYGQGSLQIDEVISKTPLGDSIVNKLSGCKWDSLLKAHAQTLTFGTGDSLVEMWNLNDEATSIENFAVIRDIDSVLKLSTGHAPVCVTAPTLQMDAMERFVPYAFVKMAAPKWHETECYPFFGYLAEPNHATSFSSDYAGTDSLGLQRILSYQMVHLRAARKMVDTAGAPHGTRTIMNMQTFRRRVGGDYVWRFPTGYEGRCLASLCLAYGVDGLIMWKSTSQLGVDTNTTEWMGGLFYGDTPSKLFDTLKVYVGPFIDKVGDLLYDLKWVDSDTCDAIGAMSAGFVDSLRSLTIASPRRPYVEVGFFVDTSNQDDYFMLVNRRCLQSDSQWVRSWLSTTKLGTGMYYVVDMYTNDTVLTGSYPTSGNIPFTTFLGPGEGKLFKVVPVGASTVAGSSLPEQWEGGIALGGNVTVDTNRSLTIYGPAVIKVDSGSSYSLSVYGSLYAQGNVQDTIQFRSKSTVPGNSDWYGIKHYGQGDVSLSYVQIRDAYNGLRILTPSAVNSISVDHCDFRNASSTGIYTDANASSAISITNSRFTDTETGGVYIYRGKASISDNTFVGEMTNGIKIQGASNRTTGAKITSNSFDSLTADNAFGIYLQTVYQDGFATGDTTIWDNTFGPTWLGESGQGAIKISNCSDAGGIVLWRNSVPISYGTLPSYGIHNFSTKTKVLGDTAVDESLSAIQGSRYGIYCISTSVSDPDYASLRQSSVKLPEAPGTPKYCVWVHATSNVDAGQQSDVGGNAFYGYSQCPNLEGFYGVVSSISNSDTVITVLAEGNYWGNRTCGSPPYQNSLWPFTDGPINTVGVLYSNPFANPLGKLVADRDGEDLPDLMDDPQTVTVAGNYPNPFNAGTAIEISVGVASPVEVSIYNVLGQQVRTLWKGDMSEGNHTFRWDGSDDHGQPVSSGVYFYRVTSPQSQLVKKMVVIK